MTRPYLCACVWVAKIVVDFANPFAHDCVQAGRHLGGRKGSPGEKDGKEQTVPPGGESLFDRFDRINRCGLVMGWGWRPRWAHDRPQKDAAQIDRVWGPYGMI